MICTKDNIKIHPKRPMKESKGKRIKQVHWQRLKVSNLYKMFVKCGRKSPINCFKSIPFFPDDPLIWS